MQPRIGTAINQPSDINRFGTNLGAGYVVSKKLPLDFRGQLTVYNLVGRDVSERTYLAVGLSAGYTFQL